MSRREPYQQQFWTVSEPWIEFMIDAARHHDHHDASSPFVAGVQLGGGHQCLHVRGFVPPHTDRAFPEWVYLLCFRADNAVVHCHGQPGIKLRPGILFEFNEHRRHRLEQPSDSTTIWTPLDSDRRLSLEEAMEGHRKQFSAGASIMPKGATEKHIMTSRHRIVYDGRIVRGYNTRNFCTAFLDRAGFAVAYRDADGEVRFPLFAMRRPRLADWGKMKALLKKHHGMELPDEVMPRFLSGTGDAHG